MCVRGCLLACSLIVPLCGCAASKHPAETPRAARSAPASRIRTELYFGLAKPGGQVTAEEWREFMETVVTPRFPDGLTVYVAQGQWRAANGRPVKEPSKVLVVIHTGTVAADRALDEIRTEYKKRFRQESVLRADMQVQASF